MKIKTILISIFLSMTALAQYPPDSTLTDPFGLLGTSSAVTSGILLNKIYSQEPRPGLISDATFYPQNIMQAYSEWYLCAQPALQPPLPDTVLFNYNQRKDSLNAYPILVVDYDFQYLKPNAVAENLIVLSNGQYIENPDATESPYLSGHKFMAGIPEDVYLNTEGLVTEIVYDSTLVLSNSGLDKSRLWVSKDGGSSFISLAHGQKLALTNALGETSIELLFKMNTLESTPLTRKVIYKKGTQAACGAPPIDTQPWPYLQRPTKVFAGYEFDPSRRRPVAVYNTVMKNVPNLIAADIAYNGSPAEGGAYVYYRPASDILPGEEGKLKKPIIICDGIDFTSGSYSGIKAGKAGNLGWKELWGCNTDEYPLYDMEYGLNRLHDAGYDIIFLDYLDADDYIQNNAYLLVKLLQLVNANKVGNEQNVVVGASMGGQVARYALTYMEENNLDHCTRLFVSYDSPWKGATIPAGVQHFVSFFRTASPEPPPKPDSAI